MVVLVKLVIQAVQEEVVQDLPKIGLVEVALKLLQEVLRVLEIQEVQADGHLVQMVPAAAAEDLAAQVQQVQLLVQVVEQVVQEDHMILQVLLQLMLLEEEVVMAEILQALQLEVLLIQVMVVMELIHQIHLQDLVVLDI
jgi:hypothetical protein